MDQNAQASSHSKDDPKLLVQTGYDQIAETYLNWTTAKPTARLTYLEKALSKAQTLPNTKVLELGCGAGIPCTRILAERCGHIVANDISQAQIDLARVNVSGNHVQFIAGDMMKLAFQPSDLDAVVAFYSIIHLPRDEQSELFKQIWSWLSLGGHLVCNLGVTSDPGSIKDWLGSRMYWSSFDAETNLQLLKEVGFDVLESETLWDDEDGKLIPFLWVLARKH